MALGLGLTWAASLLLFLFADYIALPAFARFLGMCDIIYCLVHSTDIFLLWQFVFFVFSFYSWTLYVLYIAKIIFKLHFRALLAQELETHMDLNLQLLKAMILSRLPCSPLGLLTFYALFFLNPTKTGKYKERRWMMGVFLRWAVNKVILFL